MKIVAGRNVAVFISGRGSNLKALLEARDAGELDVNIGLVVSNRAAAGGLEHAAAHGVPSAVLSHREFSSRKDYEVRLLELLGEHEVDVVVLAGFMRILTGHFLSQFPNRVLNIHPSILPAFPGVDAQAQALDYGVALSGCTVHFVDEGTDSGPVIEQAVVPVLPDDDRDSLAKRILAQEHRILPRALSLLVSGRLEVHGRKVRVLPEGE